MKKLVTLFTSFIRNLKKTFLVLKFISACAKPKWSRDKTICKWCYKKIHNLPSELKHVYSSCHKTNLKDRCRNKSWKAFPEPRKTFQYDKCTPLYCCLLPTQRWLRRLLRFWSEIRGMVLSVTEHINHAAIGWNWQKNVLFRIWDLIWCKIV